MSNLNYNNGIFPDKLALIIIGMVGILIGFLVYQMINMNNTQLQNINNYVNDPTAKINLIKDINGSTQNLFNALIPVFGAWIGAVIAFYFGAKNNENVFRSYETAQKSVQNAFLNLKSTNTVKDVVDAYPDSKKIVQCTLDDKISDVLKEIDGIDNILVNEANNPKAILYIKDLLAKTNSMDELKEMEKTLKDVINENKPVIDKIACIIRSYTLSSMILFSFYQP